MTTTEQCRFFNNGIQMEVEMEPFRIEEGVEIYHQSTVYRITKVLGSGSFGKVALCVRVDTGETVAVKFVRELHYNQVLTEANALVFLKQQIDSEENNLINFYGCFYFREYYCLLFQLLDSSLFDIIEERHYTPLKVSYIRIIAQQMLVALRALKQLGVTHTDIKPDNIMLVDRTSHQMKFKRIDFGLACQTSCLSEFDTIQNPAYRAPEVYLGLPRNEGVDMWALGCTLAFMFIGGHLFPVDSEYEALRVMLQLLGTPNNQSLDKGQNVPHFFTQEQMGSERMWRLKTKQEFEKETGTFIRRNHPAFDELHSVDDLLKLVPVIEDPTELEDTKAFLDLLKKMLAINPEDRILPADALKHRFLTMEHIANYYVREAFSIMTGCQVSPDSVSAVSDDGNASDEQQEATNIQQESSLEICDVQPKDQPEDQPDGQPEDQPEDQPDSGPNNSVPEQTVSNIQQESSLDIWEDQPESKPTNSVPVQSAANVQKQDSWEDYDKTSESKPKNPGNQMEEGPLKLEKGLSIRDKTTVYHVEKALGSGTFGKVAMGRKEETGETVALKFVKKKDNEDALIEANALEFLKQLDPQENHLIKFYTCFDYGQYHCFVFELLQSSLWDMMEERLFTPYSVCDIRVVAQQMLVALGALKRLGVAHTDIKPDNIMCVDDTSLPLQFKLIDFGLASMATHLSEDYIIQNHAYRAPEVYLGVRRDEGVDMWALACTLAFMFLGCDLFPADSEYEVLRFMLQLLGTPNKDSLDKGWQVPRFFKKEQMGSEETWRLKTKEEYQEETGTVIRSIHKVFEELHSLDDLLSMFPEIDDPAELEDMKAFIDLLKKMLAINPEERILPADALKHRFFTMEHLTDWEDSYVRRAFLVMTGRCPTKPDSVSPAGERKDSEEESQADDVLPGLDSDDHEDTEPASEDDVSPAGEKKDLDEENHDNDSLTGLGSNNHEDPAELEPSPEDIRLIFIRDVSSTCDKSEEKTITEQSDDSSNVTGTKTKRFRRVRKFFSRLVRFIRF